MGKKSAERVDRAMRHLDEKLSSKADPMPFLHVGAESPPQGLQPAKPANPKDGRSLIHSAELQAGAPCMCGDRESGRSEAQDLDVGSLPPPCKDFERRLFSALLSFIECRCTRCSGVIGDLIAHAGTEDIPF